MDITILPSIPLRISILRGILLGSFLRLRRSILAGTNRQRGSLSY